MALAQWKADPTDDREFWKRIGGQIEEGPSSSKAIDQVRQSLSAESRSARQEVIIKDFSSLEVDVFHSSRLLEDGLRNAVGVSGQGKLDALRSILRSELNVLQIATVFSKTLALRRAFRWGGIVFLNEGFDPNLREEDLSDVVPWVVTSIDLNIAEILGDGVGSRRLGRLFVEAWRRWENTTEFEKFHLFGLILRTKPKDWSNVLEEIIESVEAAQWRQKAFVDLLMLDYKNGLNTVSNRSAIKDLVAFVEAKRSTNRKSPGSKRVKSIRRIMEDEGEFDPE